MRKNIHFPDLVNRLPVWLIRGWPIGGVVLLLAIFFWPIWLSGRLPIAGDVTVGVYFPWLNQQWGYATGVPVKNPLLTDSISLLYPWRILAVRAIKAGIEPFWNGAIFSGTPLFANFQSSLINPGNLGFLVLPEEWGWTLGIVGQITVAWGMMWWWLRSLGLSRLAAFLGATAFGFCGFFQVWYWYNAHVWAGAFLPFLLLSVDNILIRKREKWIVYGALGLAVAIYAGYPQLVLYELVAVGIWAIFRGFGRKAKLGGWLKVGLMVGLGVMLAAPLILPGAYGLSRSIRKVDPVAADVAGRFLPWRNLVTLIAADFYGNPATYNFWGKGYYDNFAFYMGVVVVWLAAIGIISGQRRKEVVMLGAVGAVGLFLALPSFASKLISEWGIFGVKSMATRSLFLVDVALAGLSALGAEAILGGKVRRRQLGLVAVAAVVLVGLTFWWGKGEFGGDEWQVARRNLILPAAVSGVVAASFSGLAFLGWIRKGGMRYLVVGGLVMLSFAELYRFGWKYLSFVPEKLVFPETPALEFLANQEKPFRVEFSEVIPENMWSLYGLESAGGYDAMAKLRYGQFLGAFGSGRADTPYGRVGKVNNYESPFFDLAGIKYVMALKYNARGERVNDGEIRGEYKLAQFEPVFDEGAVVVLRNKQALPRAFWVNEVVKAGQSQEVIDEMLALGDDLGRVAVMETKQEFSLGELTGERKVEWQEYGSGREKLRVENEGAGMLVITDSFDPGWLTYVDGRQVTTYRADYAYQAVWVSKGAHEIVRRYWPPYFSESLLVAGVAGVGMVVIWQKKQEEAD